MSPCITPLCLSTNLSPYLCCGSNDLLYLYPTIVAISLQSQKRRGKNIYIYILIQYSVSPLHWSRVTLFSWTKQRLPNPLFIFMARLISLLLFFLMIFSTSAQGPPPSPGYNPSSEVNSIDFDQGFRNLWGSEHQSVDQGQLTIWLDKSSGLSSSSHMSLHFFFFFCFSPFCGRKKWINLPGFELSIFYILIFQHQKTLSVDCFLH